MNWYFAMVNIFYITEAIFVSLYLTIHVDGKLFSEVAVKFLHGCVIYIITVYGLWLFLCTNYQNPYIHSNIIFLIYFFYYAWSIHLILTWVKISRCALQRISIVEHYISYNFWKLAHLYQSQGKNSLNLYMKGKARVKVKLLLINKWLKV